MSFLGRRLFSFFNCHHRMHTTLHFIEKQHQEGDDHPSLLVDH